MKDHSVRDTTSDRDLSFCGEQSSEPLSPAVLGAVALERCPFCGCDKPSFNKPVPSINFKGSINCPACQASVPREVNDDNELIAAWNTRTHPSGGVREATPGAADFLIAWLRAGTPYSGPGRHRDYCNAVARRMESLSLPTQGGWQGIESAPRDGTRVLVCGWDFGVVGGTQHIAIALWRSDREEWSESDDEDDLQAMAYLTHWQPLPAPSVGVLDQKGLTAEGGHQTEQDVPKLSDPEQDFVRIRRGDTKEISEIIQPYRKFIRDTPMLMSLLYDIDMLPEQCVTIPGAIRLVAFCEVWKKGADGELSTLPSTGTDHSETETAGGEG